MANSLVKINLALYSLNKLNTLVTALIVFPLDAKNNKKLKYDNILIL